MLRRNGERMTAEEILETALKTKEEADQLILDNYCSECSYLSSKQKCPNCGSEETE